MPFLGFVSVLTPLGPYDLLPEPYVIDTEHSVIVMVVEGYQNQIFIEGYFLFTYGESPSVDYMKLSLLDGISFLLLALECNFSRLSHNLTYILELTICLISCDRETSFIGHL